jgi:hypothetical protein
MINGEEKFETSFQGNCSAEEVFYHLRDNFQWINVAKNENKPLKMGKLSKC